MPDQGNQDGCYRGIPFQTVIIISTNTCYLINKSKIRFDGIIFVQKIFQSANDQINIYLDSAIITNRQQRQNSSLVSLCLFGSFRMLLDNLSEEFRDNYRCNSWTQLVVVVQFAKMHKDPTNSTCMTADNAGKGDVMVNREATVICK